MQLRNFLVLPVLPVVGILLAATQTGYAVDGVIEINQVGAEAGGITPGDTAGFPVTISQSGSYRLTGNLLVSDKDTTLIHITANDVTIDLNGFSLHGLNTSPPPCTGEFFGSGQGIDARFTRRIVVKDGSVHGMGNEGISLGVTSRIERVIAERNCSTGLFVANGGLILNSQARENFGIGLFTGNASQVMGSIADLNSSIGIAVGNDSVVSSCIATGNGLGGIGAANGSIVFNNVASLNRGNGIQIGDAVLVRDNSINANQGWGITTDANTSGIGNNVFNVNALGAAQSGITIACSVVNGNAICPP